jgi:hypothetical protein
MQKLSGEKKEKASNGKLGKFGQEWSNTNLTNIIVILWKVACSCNDIAEKLQSLIMLLVV